MLKTLLDPKNDFVFKRLFGAEKNESILVCFLNDMLDLDGTAKIQQAVLQKTDLAQEASTHKAVILDVLCKDIAGNYYIIEMQVADEKDFGQRALYYLAKVYGSQLSKGDTYKKLKHVVFLAILNFNLFPKRVSYKSKHLIIDEGTKENFLVGQTYIFLELKKFRKKKVLNPLLSTKTEKWAYFFKYSTSMSDKEWEKFIEGDNIMTKAYAEIDSANWSAEERIAYDRYLIAEMDLQTREDRCKAEGEAKAKIEAARNMLAEGMATEVICKVLGLSMVEVKGLK